MSQPSRLKEVHKINTSNRTKVGNLDGIGHAGIVRRYYDQTTRLFVRFGGANEAYAIHRAVWPSKSDTFETAINFTNTELLRCLRDTWQNAENSNLARASAPFCFADLGCGIGGSLFYLAQHWGKPMRGLGLTISKTQAELAQARLGQLHSPGIDLAFVHGDYLHVPCPDQAFDAIYAIESFCHAPNPATFFAEAARLLRPGGRLIVCDDFIGSATGSDGMRAVTNREDEFWLRAYLEGWRVPNLTTFAETMSLASDQGLGVVEHADLTDRLRLRLLPRIPARLMITAARPFINTHEIIPSMIGSTALQHCLARGLVCYKFVVFQASWR